MNFKKWVKSIQAAAYNGARTVITTVGIITLIFSDASPRVSRIEKENDDIEDLWDFDGSSQQSMLNSRKRKRWNTYKFKYI